MRDKDRQAALEPNREVGKATLVFRSLDDSYWGGNTKFMEGSAPFLAGGTVLAANGAISTAGSDPKMLRQEVQNLTSIRPEGL